MKVYNYAAQEVTTNLRVPERHSDHHRQKL